MLIRERAGSGCRMGSGCRAVAGKEQFEMFNEKNIIGQMRDLKFSVSVQEIKEVNETTFKTKLRLILIANN